MKSYLRLFGIGAVFLLASVGWLVLGGITQARQSTQSEAQRSTVQTLWGSPQIQAAPLLTFHHQTQAVVERTETKDGVATRFSELVTTAHERVVNLGASAIDVTLRSDLRRRGLSWYSLYDVGFRADYSYEHPGPETGELAIEWSFPQVNGLYDGFRFLVDGNDVTPSLDPAKGVVRARVPVAPGQRVQIAVGYASRGLDRWQYQPSAGVGRLENFSLVMHTDFDNIDYPTDTLSPSQRRREGGGYRLDWTFDRLVTGNGVGMITPSRIQPGELAAELSLSAPVSLFFFFFVIFVLATLRNIDLHPINYLLIAGAFFAFHLLFAYSVDHLPLELAFALASAVSVFLVVSYLRLVVSARFAVVEAGGAQFVYLIVFSLAHFWEGFTGLTTTLLAICTLYLMMQWTGRVRWSEVLGRTAVQAG